MSIEFFQQVDALTEAGQLRRLSGAFARFIGSVGDSSPQLMAACVLLSELEGRGHSCLMLDELNADPAALLGWSSDEWRDLRATVGDWPADTDAWCDLLARCGQVWPVGGDKHHQPLVLDGERLYLRRYWLDETHVAQAVRRRALGGVLAVDADAQTAGIRRWLDELFPHAPRGGGVDWQKIACAVAMRGKLGIITGGPGTGKTYTVARLLALLFATAGEHQAGLRVALAAPTGKAAARLKQSIDTALDELAEKVGDELPLRELAARMGAARTLHSLLGARPDTRAFQHHAGNQLDVDVLIVDEASMIHLEMMSALLAALPDTATLILLGDKDQLASVEAGAVLGDLCHNAEAGEYLPETLSYVHAATGQQIPELFEGHGGAIAQQTVMLRESRRFGGPIGALALAVNAGDAATAVNVLREGQDGKVAWTDLAQSADLLQLALDGYREYLQLIENAPAALDEGGQLDWVKAVLKRFEGFRILCAVREGEWGVSGLNQAIEQRLQTAGLLKRSSEWYVGRPVMVTRNDYATGVFNGDIGLTLPDPARPGALRVYFSEGEAVRSVLATRLRNVDTAFAMTVHKSQGSEFAHTAMVLPKDGGGMLARELIYTGITRARDYFTLLTPNGQVLLDAIGQRTQRASGLRSQLEH
jgi:exodeoxyribonuclease V alpha subunit